ncbi:exonuclease SbcCD subunit D [Ligilactobacillus sp. WILCCON 0076]|uniref:Nuclease SbcCD subunit D n=1 Tax=Ligilactobacillus ubinensis TaxID=2876789 RepID=A0A9X2JMG4_9LACO|nr:exonuclease SbcCD subunit D [Ligilactobacillus ubinensis]MCP0887655.1 exonuclease SbcCD subunit D [Ligilactobacillus ubinensis]
MKILHTADWHIGKKLYEYDLYDEQKYAFQQIKEIANKYAVDAIVIAGDLYDRSIPSEQAIRLLESMLVDLNIENEFPIIAISGNHDSARRLGAAKRWYEARKYYLRTELTVSETGVRTLDAVEFADTQFFLVPFFNPKSTRSYFNNEKIETMSDAMKCVVAECKKQFKPNKAHVLVGHCFVAGSSHEDSEIQSMVGGLDEVPVDIFKDFDYVALGHLHNKNALKAKNAKYSGSPVKFSLSEIKNQKGVYIYDTLTKTEEFVALKDKTPIVKIEGSLYELCQPSKYRAVPDNAFVFVTLTDREVIPTVMQQLKQCYPRVVHVERKYGLIALKENTINLLEAKLTPFEVTSQFFSQTQDRELTTQDKDVLQKIIDEVLEEDQQ